MTDVIAPRIDRLDWVGLTQHLDGEGWARIPGLLTPVECAEAATSFRRRMASASMS
ncbi:hypothetical protein [Sphingomonas sp. MMS24-J13]|uniref:hypothetical protein n=1 Tax=Sphingomonas sp. MMS24-J13 TaxID=3238686 RepID=UPI0038504A66